MTKQVTNRPFSCRQAGEVCGRSIASMKNYIQRGEIVAHRASGRYVIMEADLLEWLGRPETIDMLRRGDEFLRRTGKPTRAERLAQTV